MNPLKVPQIRSFINDTQTLAKREKLRVYLVGGLVRDCLLSRSKTHPDIDFCLERGALSFARVLGKKLGAGFVVLDRERGYCRLVKQIRETTYTLDFTEFRGKTLEEDLLRRDFTINAMAAGVGDVLKAKHIASVLIDPHGGKADLGRKVIRITHRDNFREDPLRILRAVSMAALLGFAIDRQTMALMRRERKGLTEVSPERIRDELFKLFDTPHADTFLRKLDALSILEVVMPEIGVMRGVRQGPYHHLDVWKHSLETVLQLEQLAGQVRRDKDLSSYLSEQLSAGRSRLALMKLAALLHDVGKPAAKRRKNKKTIFWGHERIGSGICRECAKRLRLSNDEAAALCGMVFWHLRPGYLGDSPVVSPRAQFRYFRDTGREGVSTLLLAIADQRSTRGPLTKIADCKQHERICFGLIKTYFRKQKIAKPVRLVNGDELMEKFGLAPSPLIGTILEGLDELQAIGTIKTKAAAFAAAKKFIK